MSQVTMTACVLFALAMAVESAVRLLFLHRLKIRHALQWTHAAQPVLWTDRTILSARSMMLYLQTVFVAALAYVFLGESLHGYDLAGAAFIVVGLVLAAIRTKPPQAAETAQTGS